MAIEAPPRGLVIPGLDERVLAALERGFPKDLNYVIFPGNGDLLAIPAGRTTIDLGGKRASTPAGNVQLIAPLEILSKLQSAYMFADTIIEAEVKPGFGVFPLQPFITVEANARKIDIIELNSDVPFLFMLAAGMGDKAPHVEIASSLQTRYGDSTISKAVPANQADAFNSTDRALRFIARSVKNAMALSFGVNFIRSLGMGQKTFIVRNLGPGDVEVQVYGSLFKDVADGLQATSPNSAWVEDPDILDKLGGPLTIVAGDNGIVETGVPWGAIQLRARLTTGSAIGTAARLIVEYAGLAPGVR